MDIVLGNGHEPSSNPGAKLFAFNIALIAFGKVESDYFPSSYG